LDSDSGENLYGAGARGQPSSSARAAVGTIARGSSARREQPDRRRDQRRRRPIGGAIRAATKEIVATWASPAGLGACAVAIVPPFSLACPAFHRPLPRKVRRQSRRIVIPSMRVCFISR